MTKTRVLLTLLVLAAVSPAVAAPLTPMKVLVTNDDGVGAPGINALVTALAANPNLDVVVIAPASNSSGTGEQTTTATAITVTSSMTASGHVAKAVSGKPGDCSLFGILQELAATPPALVVSGINDGQNLSAEIIPISGTVGAATWAARLGVPAIAVSGQIGGPYTEAAAFTADVVESFRKSGSFRKKMKEKEAPFRGLVLNINFPTCTSGATRGVRVVAVGRANNVTSYSSTGVNMWQAVVTSTNAFSHNCASTVEAVTTDIEALTNGFAAISPLVAERSVMASKLRRFRFLQKLFP